MKTTEIDAIRGAEINERDAWEDIYRAAPAEWAAEHRLHVARIGPILAIALADLPSPQFNRAWGIGLDEPLSAAQFHDLEAFFRAAGSQSWMLQPAPLAHAEDSIARMSAAGYAAVPMRWVKVTRGLDAPAQAPRDGVIVREVSAAHAADFAAPIVRAMGMPVWMRPWIESLVQRAGWRCFAATVDGQAAGGAALFLRDGRAWFGMAATVGGLRNRGCQRLLLNERIATALRQGARFLSVETGEPMPDSASPSYHNMLACGFTPIGYRMNLLKRA